MSTLWGPFSLVLTWFSPGSLCSLNSQSSRLSDDSRLCRSSRSDLQPVGEPANKLSLFHVYTLVSTLVWPTWDICVI